jgi:hypothetical protein
MVSFLTVRERNGIAARVIVVAGIEGGMAAKPIRIARSDPMEVQREHRRSVRRQ